MENSREFALPRLWKKAKSPRQGTADLLAETLVVKVKTHKIKGCTWKVRSWASKSKILESTGGEIEQYH